MKLNSNKLKCKNRIFGKRFKQISWSPTFSNSKLPHRGKRFGCLVAEGCRAWSGCFCPDLNSVRLLSSHVGFCSSLYSWHVCEMFGHVAKYMNKITWNFAKSFLESLKKKKKMNSYKCITFLCHDSHDISNFLLFGEFEREMQIKHELS